MHKRFDVCIDKSKKKILYLHILTKRETIVEHLIVFPKIDGGSIHLKTEKIRLMLTFHFDPHNASIPV